MLPDCINYKGFIDEKGYGRIDGRPSYFAHRLAIQLATGISPRGKLVCHKCDNPSCINPDHLYMGTYQDNADDKVERNRCSRMPGEKNHFAHMSDAYAQLIINEIGTTRELCTKFGVTYKVIHDIKSGKTWKHLDRSNAHKIVSKKKLKPEDATAIRQDPRSDVEIAKAYGISPCNARKIRYRLSFKDAP